MGSSFAQVKISAGVLAGLNLANASVDPAPGNGVSLNNLTGFAFGGVINFGFAGGLGLEAEPMYIQKGVTLSGAGGEAKLKLSYIDIPAIVTYTFATGAGQIEPYVMAGPYFGILLSAKESITTNAGSGDVDIKSTTSSTDFGATFGAGAKIPVGMNRVFVEARYSLGFSQC